MHCLCQGLHTVTILEAIRDHAKEHPPLCHPPNSLDNRHFLRCGYDC